MSIADLYKARAERRPVLCFAIIANPVWGRTEDTNLVAVFDTEEQARAYIAASKLEKPSVDAGGKYVRAFRPDSLLWDYNPMAFINGRDPNDLVWGITNPFADIEGAEQSPPAPEGPCPPLSRVTEHGQYGRDYDVGAGPPREIMDVKMDGEKIVIETETRGYTDVSGYRPKLPKKEAP
jgi:hypothetical protein